MKTNRQISWKLEGWLEHLELIHHLLEAFRQLGQLLGAEVDLAAAGGHLVHGWALRLTLTPAMSLEISPDTVLLWLTFSLTSWMPWEAWATLVAISLVAPTALPRPWRWWPPRR
jgi:hypothetical protein